MQPSSMPDRPVSDFPPTETAAPILSPQRQSKDEAVSPSRQIRDRRREKPLLSCTFCRSRKVRCDRQMPCKTCTSKGIGSTCSYMPISSHKPQVSVSDRIQQLEALVRSLVPQQQPPSQSEHESQTPASVAGTSKRPPASQQPIQHAFGASPQGPPGNPDVVAAPPSVSEDTAMPSPSVGPISLSQSSKDCTVSPTPSEYGHGSMRPHAHGANYVGSVHWAAVLDSISELKDHYEQEEEARLMAAGDFMPRNSPGPRLIYEPIQDTKADILASIPSRPVLDRMVARYFNAQNSVSLPLLHSGQFLQQYESFWRDPGSAPFLWLGLLFSMMALAAQFQRSIDDSADPETLAQVHLFRERIIHCLTLGEFTRGGQYVLETMLNYITLEILLFKDADVGLWLVLGMIVQLALGMGYHRDAQNFPNISAFAGEMRRRVWAVIVQMDLRLSSQMGQQRLLKLHQCDTAEPRNLLDTDFEENTSELPSSRPETEVTPVLYILAKNRIDRMSDLVNDLLTDSKERKYTEIMELDRKLQETEASLPPVFKWQPLSQSFMVPPQIVAHRLMLHLSKQRLTIWLHRKYLAPSYTQPQYKNSQLACIQAAIEILEFQQLVDEETRPDGLLYPVRFMTTTSMGQFVFLLGMSILSYYIQLAKISPELSLDQNTSTRILDLLHNSYRIWLRSSAVSREAREATEHLSLLLGLRGQEAGGMLTEDAMTALGTSTNTTSNFTASQDTALSFDHLNWDAYQGKLDQTIAPFHVLPRLDLAPVSALKQRVKDIHRMKHSRLTYLEHIASFPSAEMFGSDFLVPPVPMPGFYNYSLTNPRA